jgi:Lhr-like helicase
LKHDPERPRRSVLKGSHNPFPYQLEIAIATGHDTVLIAPTDAGKTLALALPPLYHKTKLFNRYFASSSLGN